ncbi:hypothetical protein [Neisseria montereyensis]|uniref:ArsR family transcriptional regulator n=1 Tax=Neisseria montereyensis TaxID=2973938 RepID=A0ABT2FDR6_9NEIS|nr:hypothetical protein [Neisseria montereyensis]MCS4534278.1 hypothetical protein [Neisseria montereyensis]
MSVKELTKPKNARQKIWDVLRANQDKFLIIDEIMELSGVQYDAAYIYLISLHRGKYLTIQKGLKFASHNGYRLERNIGVEAPRLHRDGSLCAPLKVDTLWRTIKIIKQFSNEELYQHVNMTQSISRKTVSQYTAALTKAGYLVNVGTGKHKRYQLVKNTGAKAPRLLDVTEMYDPNLDQIMFREVADNE